VVYICVYIHFVEESIPNPEHPVSTTNICDFLQNFIF